MKKLNVVAGVVLVLLMAVVAFSAATEKMAVKVGDELYVCNCGEKCPCQTMSHQGGNCTCGNTLAKGKVTKVEAGKAIVSVSGKAQTFNTVGKFMCACEPACKCGSISQAPGKCSCGVPMKPAPAK